MDGFFPLKTAADLRNKLRRDFAKIEAAPLDADAYFNFFITAEHMLDWLFPGDTNRKRRSALRKGSVLLQVCSHLANGGKHLKLDDDRHKSVLGTRKTHPGTRIRALGPPQGNEVHILREEIPARLMIDLHDVEATTLGTPIHAMDLALMTLGFWDVQPLDESPPADPAG